MRHEQTRESSRGRKAVRASTVAGAKKTRRKSASAKKAVSGSKVRTVRKKVAASKTTKAKSAVKTRTLKAKRSASAKMKADKPKLRTRRAGASKIIGGAAKRKSTSSTKATPRIHNEATIDEMSFARGSEEKYSRATAHPKMRLPRKGLQKGITNMGARAEKDIMPSNSINPALRRR
ncbi:hypothetical protein [Bdellovibrio bacteriovorus]|uniref:hypothetical protein n=1 Tax=Bdellovibrio bacteriovorus TaxID=959 RepID=UPI00045BE2BD|nr:hypothetical protein [Bdellovibrio bacteriovorus]AHZ85465.1 hypothetical protein EP01_11020 [Bdellovibrio bacteriovorus]BEV70011.1 hypothetical protein Bb109J_c3431 [Bdellovibrio bacteriovorus]